MAYQASIAATQEEGGRTYVWVFLHDPAGNFPDVVEEVVFPRPLAQVTAAMRTTQRRRVTAIAIERAIIEEARRRLQLLWDRYYVTEVLPAITALKADMAADWQAQDIAPNLIHDKIIQAWTAAGLSAGVNGVPPDPIISVDGVDVGIG